MDLPLSADPRFSAHKSRQPETYLSSSNLHVRNLLSPEAPDFLEMSSPLVRLSARVCRAQRLVLCDEFQDYNHRRQRRSLVRRRPRCWANPAGIVGSLSGRSFSDFSIVVRRICSFAGSRVLDALQ